MIQIKNGKIEKSDGFQSLTLLSQAPSRGTRDRPRNPSVAYMPLEPSGMIKPRVASLWSDLQTYRRAYILTSIASFGGMLFGFDTGQSILKLHQVPMSSGLWFAVV